MSEELENGYLLTERGDYLVTQDGRRLIFSSGQAAAVEFDSVTVEEEDGTLTVKWEGSFNQVDHFSVQVSEDGGLTWNEVGSVSGESRSFSFSGDATKSVQVVAMSANGSAAGSGSTSNNANSEPPKPCYLVRDLGSKVELGNPHGINDKGQVLVLLSDDEQCKASLWSDGSWDVCYRVLRDYPNIAPSMEIWGPLQEGAIFYVLQEGSYETISKPDKTYGESGAYVSYCSFMRNGIREGIATATGGALVDRRNSLEVFFESEYMPRELAEGVKTDLFAQLPDSYYMCRYYQGIWALFNCNWVNDEEVWSYVLRAEANYLEDEEHDRDKTFNFFAAGAKDCYIKGSSDGMMGASPSELLYSGEMSEESLVSGNQVIYSKTKAKDQPKPEDYQVYKGSIPIQGLNQLYDVSANGKYILGSGNGKTWVWAENALKNLDGMVDGVKCRVVGRKISNELIVPLGDKIWQGDLKKLETKGQLEGKTYDTLEVCGHPSAWSSIKVSLVSPDHSLLAGTAINQNGEERLVLLVPMEIVRETKQGSGKYQPLERVPVFQGDPNQFGGISQAVQLRKGTTIQVDLKTLDASRIDTMSVDIQGVNGNNFSGLLTETGINTLTFTDQAKTLIIKLENVVNVKGVASRVDAEVTGFGYVGTKMTLCESSVGNGNYLQLIRQAESESVNFSPSTTNHLVLKLISMQEDLLPTVTVNAVETIAGSGVFVDAEHYLTVRVTGYTGANGDVASRLQCEVFVTNDATRRAVLDLAETSVNSRIFVLQYVISGYSGNFATVENNDPTQNGNGICYVRMAAPWIKTIQMQAEGEDDRVDLEMTERAEEPGLCYSNPFILLPKGTTKNYPSYKGQTIRSLRVDPQQTGSDGKAARIKYIVKNDENPEQVVRQMPREYGMFVGWSILDLLRGDPTVEENLNSPDAQIRQEEQEALDSIVAVKTQADVNLQLSGSVRACNLFWSDPAELKNIVQNYDYILLTCHGITRSVGNFLDYADSSKRVSFGGFMLLKLAAGAGYGFEPYTPERIKGMQGVFGPKLVFLSSCGSAESRAGSKAQAMADAFGSTVYIGWDDEVWMRQACFAEATFFTKFKEEVSVQTAVDRANERKPAKIELEEMIKHPGKCGIAHLIPLCGGEKTAKELTQAERPKLV